MVVGRDQYRSGEELIGSSVCIFAMLGRGYGLRGPSFCSTELTTNPYGFC